MSLDCGDHGCLFAKDKSGQRTNNHCRCLDELPFSKRVEVRKELVRLRTENAKLNDKIAEVQTKSGEWMHEKDEQIKELKQWRNEAYKSMGQDLNIIKENAELREERDKWKQFYEERRDAADCLKDPHNEKVEELNTIRTDLAKHRAMLKRLAEGGCHSCGRCPVCGGEPGDPPFAGYDKGAINHKRGCRLEGAGKEPTDEKK